MASFIPISFLLATVGVSAVALGQSGALDSAALARAGALREKVVKEFGSPAQRAAFSHTNDGKPAKMPKLGHSINTLGPEDMAAMNDFVASRQQPSEIYDTVYASLTYPELYRAPLLDGIRYGAKTRKIARVEATVLFSLYSFVPTEAGVALERSVAGIGNKAEDTIEAHQEELVALSRLKESEKLIALMLAADEFAEFQRGSYPIRAAKLFKAAVLALDRQDFPDAYVLQMCDPHPAMDRYGAGTRTMMAQLAPQDTHFRDTTWSGLSELAKWRAVTEAQREFLRAGEAYFTGGSQAEPGIDLQDASSFLDAVPSLGEGRSAAIILAMGPQGATAWKQASAPERERMERTASAMNAAFELLLNTLIVEVREAELKAPDG